MEISGNDGKSYFSSSRKWKHSGHRKGFSKADEGERLALISLTSRKGKRFRQGDECYRNQCGNHKSGALE